VKSTTLEGWYYIPEKSVKTDWDGAQEENSTKSFTQTRQQSLKRVHLLPYGGSIKILRRLIMKSMEMELKNRTPQKVSRKLDNKVLNEYYTYYLPIQIQHILQYNGKGYGY
jgi:hypothetical protein